jgi:hypothetical protein
MEKPFDKARVDRTMVTVASRVDKSDYRKTEISAFIASLSSLISTAKYVDKYEKVLFGGERMAKASTSLENTLRIYTYLRDEYDIKTVGDGLRLLEDRKVDPKTVGNWVEKGMVRNDIAGAIAKGYPEYKDKALEQQYKP